MKLFHLKIGVIALPLAALSSISFSAKAQEALSEKAFEVAATARKDVNLAYNFGSWFVKSTPTLSGVPTFFTLAIENAITDEEQHIINEDYPSLTLDELKQAAIQDADAEGKTYAETKNLPNQTAPVNPVQTGTCLTPGSIRQTPLGKRGVGGMSGCYMHASLQLLRIELLSLGAISNENGAVLFPNYPALNKSIAYLPNLRKFLRNEIISLNDDAALCKEMASFIDWQMIERPWTSDTNAYLAETGNESKETPGGDLSVCFRAWSYLLYAPPVMEVNQVSSENSTSQNSQEYKYAAHLRELFVPKKKENEISMKQLIEQDLNQRGRELIGSLPPVISYELIPSYYKNSQKGRESYDVDLLVTEGFSSVAGSLLDPVQLSVPSQNNSSATTVTLTPIAISPSISHIQPGGHGYTFIKEGGNWYEMNNGTVFPVPKEWESEMVYYFSRYPTRMVVSYAASESPSIVAPDSSFTGSVIAAPSDAEAAAIHTQFQARPVAMQNNLLNTKFYLWCFYKKHPDLFKELNLTQPLPATQ